ncbi:MAG: ATP-binding cassette domain-containing protein [Desulfobacterota bacterium]|nr:ATP-binding cassette domain-containing protein [Thermodesulfobacteriota bacterium]MDW8001621.1 ATP-binding cassette domain-containing protein [Deltaproteobacteria bacterium]
MVELKGVCVEVGNFHLKDIDLEIKEKEYFVILGPNGAGKTVLVESIVGFHKLKKGSIFIDGKDLTHVPPEERKVGYVPQDCVLFPFLNVKENLEFGLKIMKYPKEKIKERVEFLAHSLEISHLLKRDVRTLSGGERQKVALARALAPFPKLLLLDEPLANIDLSTSKFLRLELKRMKERFNVTTIHVTHNLVEAEELADRMAIMSKGRIEQIGTPREIFFFPKNESVSRFMGTMNILDVENVRPLGYGLYEATCGDLPLVIPYEKDGMIRKIALSSRDIYVSPEIPPGPPVNRFKGIVKKVEEFSHLVQMNVEVGKNHLTIELPRETFHKLGLATKKEVFLIFKLRRIRVYEE